MAIQIMVRNEFAQEDSGQLYCPQCGDELLRTKIFKCSAMGQIAACGIGVIGLPLLLIFPGGTFLGIVMIAGASGLGSRKIKVWKCRNCGYVHRRN